MVKKTILYGALFSSAILAATSCTKLEDVYDPNVGINQKPESEYFDFVTTQTPTLNLDYGTMGGNALIEIFDHNPIVSSENEESEEEEAGGYTLDSEALYKVFLDKKGCTNQKITLPAGVKNVWLYSHNWGVPTLVEANYSNGVISYNATNATSRAVQTRGALNTLKETITANLVDKNRKFYTLVGWDNYGKADDFNGLYSEGDLTAEMISTIQHFYWNGQNSKPKGIDNRKYCVETNAANPYISPDAKDKDGNPIKSAQIWVTLVNETATLQNGLGYYFYKEGEVPTDKNSIEKFIIVPNFSIVDYAVTGDPYYIGKDAHVNAPAKNYMRIQLLFKDEKGNFTPEFPVGYRIGFFRSKFCWSQGKYTVNVTDDGQNFYSNVEWNGLKKLDSNSSSWIKEHGNEGTNHRFSCIRLSNGSLVYGLEDSGDTDWSADDITFMVTSNPSNCFGNSGMTTVESIPVPDADQTTYNTYAFEDMWPTGGDYDLNDVMVEHECKVISNVSGGNEYVTKIEDTFTFVQPADAATYIDAFAVQYASTQRGAIVLPDGATDETETGSIIICENTKGNLKKSFTVTRTFSDQSLLKKDLITDLNPFIISQYKKGDSKRKEVHLPKHKATSKADQSLNNHKDDAYYIDKDGQYPFAISIPKKGFTPSTEKSRINVEYTKFDNWVKTGGEKDADWYNYCTKKQSE